ncbi:UNVERIFIED_CONTAM: Glutamate receptor 1.2 [Sesamum calycinum]|uniref:Glutamate receptor 1.2 n=1 Tax=Sesamum calycinum TaxID=2727403 RepID=A0AAW2SDS0_9LAMI
MTKIHAVFLLTLLFFGFCGQYTNEQKLPISLNYVDRDIVNVGVIVDMGSWEGKVVRSCIKMAVSDFYSRNSRYRTRVQLHFRETGGDSLLATAAVSASDIEHPYFFQVAEDETAQFHAIASFFRASKWTNCAILYEDTADARRVQSYLYDILHESRVHVASQIAISPKATDDKMIVRELHKLKSSVIVVHMSPLLHRKLS